MWPFRKREPEPSPTINFDGMAALGEAFAKSFAAQIEGNARIATVFASFINQMGDLSIKQAARALGQRSATKREGRRERNSNGTWRKGAKYKCALCEDPQTRNVSIEMIKAHRLHEAGMEATPPEDAPTDSQLGGPTVPTELN